MSYLKSAITEMPESNETKVSWHDYRDPSDTFPRSDSVDSAIGVGNKKKFKSPETAAEVGSKSRSPGSVITGNEFSDKYAGFDYGFPGASYDDDWAEAIAAGKNYVIDKLGRQYDMRAIKAFDLDEEAMNFAADHEMEFDPVHTGMKEGLDQVLHMTHNASLKIAAEVGHEEWQPERGERVKHTPTGRVGKVTVFDAHTASVDFEDGKNPPIRSVFIAELEPAPIKGSKAASTSKQASAGEMLKGMLDDYFGPGTVDEAKAKLHEDKFDHHVRTNKSEALAWLRRECAGDMREIEASLVRQHKWEDDHVLQAVMQEPMLREALKDRYWNEFLLEADINAPRHTENLPQPVVDRALNDMERHLELGDLDPYAGTDYSLLTHENEDRRDEEPNFPEAKSTKEKERFKGAANFDFGNDADQDEIDYLVEAAMSSMHVREFKAPDDTSFDADFFQQEAVCTPGDESLISTMSEQRLTEERPRMLPDRVPLVRAAVDAFRKGIRNITGRYRIESNSLQKIEAKKVSDIDGKMIEGMMTWHVKVSGHMHRRKVAVDLLMPVIGGEPQADMRLRTIAGKEMPLTVSSLDHVMRVTDRHPRADKQYTSTTFSYRWEV